MKYNPLFAVVSFVVCTVCFAFGILFSQAAHADCKNGWVTVVSTMIPGNYDMPILLADGYIIANPSPDYAQLYYDDIQNYGINLGNNTYKYILTFATDPDYKWSFTEQIGKGVISFEQIPMPGFYHMTWNKNTKACADLLEIWADPRK